MCACPSLFGASGSPSPGSFTGTFTSDSDQREFFFTLAAPGTVTVRTYSYAGGVNAAGATIPAGGFDPTLTLFDSTGLTLAVNQDGGCALVAPDPLTAASPCWDAFISATLPAGTYRVILTQSINLPAGPNLTDSFIYNPTNLFGNSNLSGNTPAPPFGGQANFAGGFVNFLGTQRTAAFALDIAGAPAVVVPAITSSASLPAGITGTPYSPQLLTVQGGPGAVYTWSAPAQGLPPGLTLSPSGTISGLPTTPGVFNFLVQATDGIQSLQQTASITIATPQPPPAPPLTISQSAGTVSVVAGAAVAASFSAGGGVPPYSFTASGLPSGVSLSSAGALTGSTSQPGLYNASVQVSDAAFHTASTSVTISVLGLPSGALRGGTAGQFYSASVAALGGTPGYTYSASGLPSGLAVSTSGNLTGIVKIAGNYTFSITATDSGGLSVTGTFSIAFAPAQPLTISSPQLPSATVDTPYSQSLNAVGGVQPYSWSVSSGSLPGGLSLSSSGTVSGTPTDGGKFSFGLTVTDGAGASVVGTGLITIQYPPLIISPSSLPTGVAGTPYPQTVLTAAGGKGPFTFSITTGSLPNGLSLSSDGSITGTPLESGNSFPFTVAVTNPVKATGAASYSLNIRSAGNADLVLSSGSLSFSIGSPASSVPPSQAFSVQSTQSAQTLGYTLAVNPAASWLTVNHGGTTPDSVQVAITPAALALTPGDYTASITLTCTSLSCAKHSQNVSVDLSVAAAKPQLQVGTDLLSFGTSTASLQSITQNITISNAGGGSLGITSIGCEDSWCSVSGAPATLAGGVSASISVTVNPGLLTAGFFRSQVDIATTAGTGSVPLTAFITAASSMTLAPVGTQFALLAGGAPGNPNGSFLVSASSFSPVNYTASVPGGTPWLTVNTPSGTSTVTQPGSVSYSVNSQAAQLTPGTYYGLVEVAGSGVVNSPQDFEVVLNVAPANTPVIPDPQPGGLLFITNAGGTPPPQTVTLYSASVTPSGFQASAAATDGAGWLSVSPLTGTASTASPGQTTVTVDATGLKPGVYHGGVSYSLSATAVRVVNVTAIVTAVAGQTSAAVSTTSLHRHVPEQAATGCSPKVLAPTQTGLVNNFASPVAWPTPLSIVLYNDCGSAVSNAQIVATFSNGDPPLALTLADANRGFYSGTWTSRKVASQVTIVAHSSAPGYPDATTQIVGSTVPNAAPILTPHGTLHSFYPIVGAALAPGTIIQIYGQNLASVTAQPVAIPLPTSMNGTSVIVGGVPAPLYYVSPGQINAQLPFELDATKQYQVFVTANGAYTTPETVQLSPASPGVAAFANGTLIAQHGDGSLVSSDSPARPGEYLAVYLAGLGVTNATPPSGAASPTSPLARPLTTPRLTIDGSDSPVAFAGLTPGLVGLYQMNFQVPAGLPAGTITVVVSQNDQTSNRTVLPYQP